MREETEKLRGWYHSHHCSSSLTILKFLRAHLYSSQVPISMFEELWCIKLLSQKFNSMLVSVSCCMPYPVSKHVTWNDLKGCNDTLSFCDIYPVLYQGGSHFVFTSWALWDFYVLFKELGWLFKLSLIKSTHDNKDRHVECDTQFHITVWYSEDERERVVTKASGSVEDRRSNRNTEPMYLSTSYFLNHCHSICYQRCCYDL